MRQPRAADSSTETTRKLTVYGLRALPRNLMGEIIGLSGISSRSEPKPEYEYGDVEEDGDEEKVRFDASPSRCIVRGLKAFKVFFVVVVRRVRITVSE